MKKALVIFTVGTAHPLYNKEVWAEILEENCGYNKKGIYAKTLDQVYWPENEEGILKYKNGNFVGYETSTAHFDSHEGYVKSIVKWEE